MDEINVNLYHIIPEGSVYVGPFGPFVGPGDTPSFAWVHIAENRIVGVTMVHAYSTLRGTVLPPGTKIKDI